MGYNDLFCDDYAEMPIEHGCKAIFLMQNTEEYNDIVDILKKKVIDYFNNIPIKNGEKQIGYYHYEPTGLCYRMTTSGNKTGKIILEPYEAEIEEKNAIRKFNYSRVRCYNPVWHMQIKLYLGKKFYLNYKDCYDCDKKHMNIVECINKYNAYKDLNEDIKKNINAEELFEVISESIEHSLIELYLCNINSSIKMLSESGIKKILELYDTFDKEERDFYWEDCVLIEKMLKSLQGKDIVELDVKSSDFIIKKHYKTKPDYNGKKHKGEKNYYSVERFINLFIPAIEKVEKDHPYIRILFEKVKFIEKKKKTKVKEEETKCKIA